MLVRIQPNLIYFDIMVSGPGVVSAARPKLLQSADGAFPPPLPCPRSEMILDINVIEIMLLVENRRSLSQSLYVMVSGPGVVSAARPKLLRSADGATLLMTRGTLITESLRR